MSTQMIVAQCAMAVVLILMISGKTPLYLTAILGSALVALIAGFPLSGSEPVTVAKLVSSGLIGVIADMTGVLMFIGILQASGFLGAIVRSVIRFGTRFGGAPGVIASGAVSAGIIGMLTGYAPPIVTGAIGCPAAVKMGMDPNRAAGSQGHAGILGNFGGFTHPTQVAIIGSAGIGFGMINIAGAITALSVILCAFVRNYIKMKKEGKLLSREQAEALLASTESEDIKKISSWKAFFPFLLMMVGFAVGFPVFIVGITCGLITLIMSGTKPSEGESQMINGLKLMSIPLVATIGFVFMGSVIKAIGMTQTINTVLQPVLDISPLLVMILVSCIAGLVTQSYSASGALTIPLLPVIIAAGVSPLAAAIAACGPAAIFQHFLTGGPVANLPTLIPVTPGSNLKEANLFQRPNHVVGLIVCTIVAFTANALA